MSDVGRGRWRRRVLLAVLALLPAASCQPLPHPFADDLPPKALMTVRDSLSIAVAPIDGVPHATAEKLAPAIARAFLKRDIPASATTTGLNSYQLYGAIRATPVKSNRSTVTAEWRLRSAGGALLGARTASVAATGRQWLDGDPDAVARLATASADALAGLVQDERPVEAPAGGQVRVRVGKIAGATGDGDTSLAAAMRDVLRHQNIALVDAAGAPADLQVDATVAISPAKGSRQHVKIVWRVDRGKGGEIGTVAQENDLPAGTLDGSWGDVAYAVAMSAQDGVMALVNRAGPAPDASPVPPSAAATPGAAGPSPAATPATAPGTDQGTAAMHKPRIAPAPRS